MVHFPQVGLARTLGVGLDLSWGSALGFGPGPAGDAPTPATCAFFEGPAKRFGHVFVSHQPRDRSRPAFAHYERSWDRLFALVPQERRALHTTSLNLGALVPYGRTDILELAAALVDRHGLAWVNEDIGFWSLDGRPLAYPLPPVLDARALAPATRAVRECQRGLPVPLLVEFPGFSARGSVVVGQMHAYDFFRALAEETESAVTLDVGHLLSYQWLRGRRDAALFDELERLPLAHCFELHLAGSSIVDGHFVDAHHGALLEEQLTLLERLLPLCPNARAVTFEDPVLDAHGRLDAKSAESLALLDRAVAGWLGAAPPVIQPERTAEWNRPPETDLAELERELARAVAAGGVEDGAESDPLVAEISPASLASLTELCIDRWPTRVHRGLGTIEERFPRTIAAWRELHPEDHGLRALARQFLTEDTVWRERPAGPFGASMEQAFGALAERLALADAVTREEETVSAVIRALALSPEPAFAIPRFVRRAPCGYYALTHRASPRVLHAASSTRYLRGPVTPLVAALLDGATSDDAARQRNIPMSDVAQTRTALERLGLLSPLRSEPDAARA